MINIEMLSNRVNAMVIGFLPFWSAINICRCKEDSVLVLVHSHLHIVLFLQRPHNDLSLSRGYMLSEQRLLNKSRSFLIHLLCVGVVLAWRSQRAFWASFLLNQHVALEVYSCMLQLVKALILKLFPDLFFGLCKRRIAFH